MRLTPSGGFVPVNCSSARTAAALPVNSTAYQDLAVVPVNADGGRPLLVLLSFLMKNDTTGARTYTARMMLNGSPVSEDLVCKLPKSVEAGENLPYSFHFFADALPPGNHSMSVQIKSDSALPGQYMSERRITVIEF